MDREFDTAPVPRLVLPHIAPVTEVFWAATISDLLGAAVTVTVFCTRIAPRLQRELDEGAA